MTADVESIDLLSFLRAWFGGAGEADVNGDGEYDSLDWNIPTGGTETSRSYWCANRRGGIH